MQTASDWTYLSRRYGLAALLALTFVIFAGALNYAPLENLDDWAYVTENPNLGFSAVQLKALVTEPVLDLYTPLPMLTYLADYACGGVSPFAYHLQNLLWHLCAVWLAWLLLRELGLRRESALLAALIFAVHPQRVESVVWISERKDVMCTVFVLMSLVLHLQARRHGARFSIASAVTMVLGLFRGVNILSTLISGAVGIFTACLVIAVCGIERELYFIKRCNAQRTEIVLKERKL